MSLRAKLVSALGLLLADLRESGIVTKVRHLSNGQKVGGIPFTRGPLAYLLRNRFYIGEVVYRGSISQGEHQPIVDRASAELERPGILGLPQRIVEGPGEAARSRDLGVGVIRAEDGRAYRFEGGEIRNRREDLEGQEVHFRLGELKARDIIVLAGSPWAAFGSIGI